MHRQKTIAKWLAVILSLTIAVACYIALSAITDGKSNDNVAGANDNEYPQNQIPQPPSPVYSVLPRKCEIIGDKNIAHFGGEAEEKMLDAFVFANKNVMIVSCDSKQYDVSETGRPRLINDKYMIASSNEYIMPYRILSIGKIPLNFIAYSITSFFDYQ